MKTIITTRQTVALAVSVLAMMTLSAAAKDTTSNSPHDRSYSGQVDSVNRNEGTVRVKSWWFSSKRFNIGENCKFDMTDNNDVVGDLRPGEKVTVYYQVLHGVRVADRIEQHPMLFTGMVTDINTNALMMTVHRSGLDKTMRISKECQVVLNDDKAGKVSDIKRGDHVTVIYETPGEWPTAHQIAQTSEVFTGKLTAVDLDSRTLKAKGSFDTMKFNLGDDCTIVINGSTDGKLDELKPGERLVLNYETIDGINVVNRIAPSPVKNHGSGMYTVNPGYPGYPAGY